jgi:hypothetical protein
MGTVQSPHDGVTNTSVYADAHADAAVYANVTAAAFDGKENVVIECMGLKLMLTSGACPEQYDVFLDGAQVGYIRLRHGRFRADCPDVGGETVYVTDTKGDGRFYDEEERRFQLGEACKAIKRWLDQQKGSSHD